MLENLYIFLFIGGIAICGVLVVFALIRAIRGPRVADRIIAINMMGTLVIIIIALLAVLIDEPYLVDISIIYAMISFLAVVVLTKVYMGAHEQEKYINAQKEKALKEREEKTNGVD